MNDSSAQVASDRNNTNASRGVDRRKSLWIIYHYAAIPTKDGSEGLHYALARYLSPLNWDTTVIAASTSHPSGRQNLSGKSLRKIVQDNGVQSLWLRSPQYGHSLFQRTLNLIFFSAALLVPRSVSGLPRPDIVFASAVHPVAALAASRLARRYQAPFVYEIGDVWPDSLEELGKIKNGGILARSLRHMSARLVSRASLVTSPLPRIPSYLNDLGFYSKPFVWIPSGTDPDSYGTVSTGPPGQQEARPFRFMYFGSFNYANAIEVVLRAFDQACRLAPDIPMACHIVGHGPRESELKHLASTLHRSSIIFEPAVPRTEVIRKAQEADCMVTAMHNLPVYRYGISPQKVFDYLLSGRPTLFACSAPDNPVQLAEAGTVTPADDINSLAAAMVDMATSSPAVRAAMGERGRAYVSANFTYRTLAHRLDRELTALTVNLGTRT